MIVVVTSFFVVPAHRLGDHPAERLFSYNGRFQQGITDDLSAHPQQQQPGWFEAFKPMGDMRLDKDSSG
jgi:hypothetical protein